MDNSKYHYLYIVHNGKRKKESAVFNSPPTEEFLIGAEWASKALIPDSKLVLELNVDGDENLEVEKEVEFHGHLAEPPKPEPRSIYDVMDSFASCEPPATKSKLFGDLVEQDILDDFLASDTTKLASQAKELQIERAIKEGKKSKTASAIDNITGGV